MMLGLYGGLNQPRTTAMTIQVPITPAPPAARRPAGPAPTIVHEGQTFLVADRSDFLAYIDAARHLPQMRSAPRPASPATAPATFSLAQFQTSIKNQLGRGTCWAFAGAAAVEAAYLRKHKVTLDLSEQYIASMAKVQELAYDKMSSARFHENNSTLWDGQGASDIIVKMSQSAVPLEAAAPYLDQPRLTAIQATIPGGASLASPGLDPLQSVMDAFELRDDLIPPASRAACRYAATGWADPGHYDSATLEGVIAGGHEVAVDIVLDWAQDANGIYQYNSAVTNGAGHCLLLIGYDRDKQYFLAKNSWGGNDYFKLGYSFIDHCCQWAHYVTDVAAPDAAPQKRAFWPGVWNMDHDGWRGTLYLRRSIDYRATNIDAPIRLGTYVRDGVQHDVNGSFGENGQSCTFYVADSGDRVAPGTLAGQRFDVYCFSWDIDNAAGRTTSGGAAYGVVLSRKPLPPEHLAKFAVANWLGSYAVNHDGWRGTLRINSVTPFAATYTDDKGHTTVVHGTVEAHELKMTIGSQPFDLLYHTWESGVFSGTTVWSGTTFGVIGFKNA